MQVCLNVLMSMNHHELAIMRSFLAAQRHHKLLVFDVEINGRRYKAMIDSGSSKDIIDKSVFEEAKLQSRQIDATTIYLADETPIICDTVASRVGLKFVNASNNIDGRMISARFKDYRDLSILDLKRGFEIILGQPFLCQRNPHIDWVRRSMILKSSHNVHDVGNPGSVVVRESLRVIAAADTVATTQQGEHDTPRASKDYEHVVYKHKAKASDHIVTKALAKSCASLAAQIEALAMDSPADASYASDFSLLSLEDETEVDDNLEVVDAETMRRHLRKLRKDYPGTQCALAVLTVPAEDQLDKETSSTLQISLPFQTKASDWVLVAVEPPPPSSKERLLQNLRKKVKDRFEKTILSDGTPLMIDKLPKKQPRVRFEKDGEMAIEVDPEAKIPSSGVIPLSADQLAELRKQMEFYISRGFWRPSTSPYAAPILFAPKTREDGTLEGWRLCVDYRKLNAITKQDKFPLPNPETLVAQLQGTQYFSKIDLTQFFHQIPMKEEDVHKTAMVCRYGSYEWTVMPFGLMNAPAVAVRFGQRIFHDFLDRFMALFLDDLLIYSKTIEEHLEHIEKVRKRLEEYEMYVRPDKCHFFVTEVNYLGLGISQDGVFIQDHRKKAIEDWPTPDTPTNKLASRAKTGVQTRNRDGKTGIRSFLGVVGFFRKFIKDYAKIAAPLTDVLKAENEFFWGEEQQHAFEALKKAITAADVLQIPSSDPNHPMEILPDGSKVAVGAVMLQDQGKGMRPCIYLSKRLSDKQSSWGPYELELFALTHTFQTWKPYLIGREFIVRSDHSPLKYYHSQEKLTDKLIRQLDFLSEFRFKVLHIPGKDNTAADGLSRRPDHYMMPDGTDRPLVRTYDMDHERVMLLLDGTEYLSRIHKRLSQNLQLHQSQQAKAESREKSPKATLSILQEDISVADELGIPEVTEVCTEDGEDCTEVYDHLTVIAGDILAAMFEVDSDIIRELQASYKKDLVAKAVLSGRAKRNVRNHYQVINGLVFRRKPDGSKALYVPKSAVLTDSKGEQHSMRELICYECHDSSVAGHLGVTRMSALIRRNFYWPNMTDTIKKQVRECFECQQNKATHGRIQGLSKPLIPPIKRWSEVSLDFITDLPVTSEHQYDAIMVVMDQTSRMVHLIPYKMIYGAVETAGLYFREIFRLHGLPDRIMSDRDTRFTSAFWKELWRRCGTKLNMTTTYHPQSNSANERSHKVIEELMRSLVTYPPFEWDEQLPIIEFVLNNSVNRETGYSPFEICTGEAPLDPASVLFPSAVDRRDQSVEDLLQKQSEIVTRARQQLIASRQAFADRVNRTRIQPDFKVGDMVMLKSKHLNWPGVDILGKHLKPAQVGPFKVVKMNQSKTAVELEWDNPRSRVCKVQPVSRCIKFRPDTRSTRKGRNVQPTRMYNEEGEEVFEIDRIVGRRERGQKTFYLVKWKGYTSRQNTWEPKDSLIEAGQGELLRGFDKHGSNNPARS